MSPFVAELRGAIAGHLPAVSAAMAVAAEFVIVIAVVVLWCVVFHGWFVVGAVLYPGNGTTVVYIL
jgi:hypothetical protein